MLKSKWSRPRYILKHVINWKIILRKRDDNVEWFSTKLMRWRINSICFINRKSCKDDNFLSQLSFSLTKKYGNWMNWKISNHAKMKWWPGNCHHLLTRCKMLSSASSSISSRLWLFLFYTNFITFIKLSRIVCYLQWNSVIYLCQCLSKFGIPLCEQTG